MVLGTKRGRELRPALWKVLSDSRRAAFDRLGRCDLPASVRARRAFGHRLVVDWYEKYRNTPFEGAPLPWPDHKYAGHDINRDAFMMNMSESRNLARFFYGEWHPQVFLSMHQLEADGPRFVAPPVTDPIDPNIDPIVWREAALLGSAMTLELERDRHTGVVSNSMFDYYWPGYEDSAPLGHNTICLLTEAASVKIAAPVTQPPPDQRGRVSAPHPWPGGRWALRDIVEYDLSAVRGLLRAVSAYREELVRNFYSMGRRAIEAGQKGGPFAYVIPSDQQDSLAAIKLKQLLIQGGVEIQRAQETFGAGGTAFPAGTDIIFLAQPYRAYVKTLLERQDYPAGDKSMDRPYDATGWTLPAQMAVDVRVVDKPFEPPLVSRVTDTAMAPPPGRVWGDSKPSYYLVDARGNTGAVAANRLLNEKIPVSWLDAPIDVNGFHYAAGTLVVANGKNARPAVSALTAQLGLRADGLKGKTPATHGVSRARTAVYQPRGENADAGWTRWVLERYEFPESSISSITNADVVAGSLRARFDVIVLPNAPLDMLMRGLSSETMPQEYVGGLEGDGVRALDAFVRAGGTLVCLDQAGALAIDAFKLPIKDVARTSRDEFYGPGSILRIDLDTAHPLSYGLPAQTSSFFSSSSAFEVAPNAAGLQSAVRYASKDLRVSGWVQGEGVIAGRSAVVQAAIGTGRVILLGFPVQHRGQSLATFRLLFNAILSSNGSGTGEAARRR